MPNELFQLRDAAYAEFLRKLLPTVPPQSIIGVRTPQLKTLAKSMIKNGAAEAFTAALPHGYFEENQLHAFILNECKDPGVCIEKVIVFLPYIDNWATCDQLSPKTFAKQPLPLLPHAEEWIASPLPFTVRFGIGVYMRYFLNDLFRVEYADAVAQIRSDEYYVNMMIAWYFATALAKQYDAALPFLEQRVLPVWTHNKAITKAVESYRITPEQKAYLRTLKETKNK